MIRRPVLFFFALTGTLTLLALAFIQSRLFGRMATTLATRYLPSDLGVEATFNEISVGFVPPALTVHNPKIQVRDSNVLGLPAGSQIGAQEVSLVFRFFQMLSGQVQVDRVVVSRGDVRLAYEKLGGDARTPSKPLASLIPKWEELLRVRTNSVELNDTAVFLSAEEPRMSVGFKAERLVLEKGADADGRPVVRAELEVQDLRGEPPKGIRLPGQLDVLRARAVVGAKEIRFEELAVERQGIQLGLSGVVSGDWLHSSNSPIRLDSDVKIEGEGRQLLAVAGESIRLPQGLATDLAGRLGFSGKVSADDLTEPLKTLEVSGLLTGEALAYRAWRAERVVADLHWRASATGGTVKVRKIVVESPERKKEGAHQPASGGKIVVGELGYRFGQNEPIQATVQLDGVHLQWLAAPAIAKLYAFDFKASGPVQAEFTPPRGRESWRLSAGVDLQLEELILDNQKLGKPKPRFEVIRAPIVRAKGRVEVDETGLEPKGFSIAFGTSKAEARGRVDFETGLDLYATGKVDLSDVGKLAEQEIRGSGALDVHVHGPIARVLVDFDFDLEKAYYLSMALGGLKGRITFDEDPRLLFLRNVRGTRGATEYAGGGRIDVGDHESIALDIESPKGSTQDFIQIFADLTSDIWWFPKTLTGVTKTSIRVRGGLSTDELEVYVDEQGSQWQYWGERFKSVEGKGGYYRGRFFVENAKARKQAGDIVGSVSFDRKSEQLDWRVRTDGMTLTDLDHFARLDIPIRGSVAVESKGGGKVGAVESSTAVRLTGASVRSVPYPNSELVVSSAGGVMRLHGNAMEGQAVFDASYDFKDGNASYLRGEARELDFAPILLLLNPRNIQDPELVGRVSGAINLSFQTGRIELASGSVAFNDYRLAKTGARFTLREPVAFAIDHGTFRIPDLSLRGNTGILTLRLDSREGALQGEIGGQIENGILEFLTPVVSGAAGLTKANFVIGGKIKEPELIGRLDIAGAELRSPSLEAPIENIRGVITLKQTAVQVESLEGELAGGKLTGGGGAVLYANKFPDLDLFVNLGGNRIKVYPFQFVKVRGKLKIHGKDVPYAVDGSIYADSALSREPFLSQAARRSFRTAMYQPMPRSRQESDFPKFILDFAVQSDGGILVKNDLFDCELKAKIRVVNTIDNPRIVGNAEMVQGRLLFKETVFNIQNATVHFDSPAVFNPRFTLYAQSTLGDVKVQLNATGKMDAYKIELTSTPSMPEQEILSLLALGLTSADRQKLKAGDRALVEQGGALDLLLNSLDFNRDVQDKTGFKLELGETTAADSGSSVFKPMNEGDAALAPKIVLKRQILKNVDVSVGSTVGVGSSDKREVNAEYKVAPGVSVIGVWDILEGQQGSGQKSTTRQQSYGFDLKLEKRFK